MCETMQSSHLLSDVLGVEVFFLAPTASGDGAGTRFCAPLPPSPPPFRGIVENIINFLQKQVLTFFFRSQDEEVTVASGGNFWVGNSKIILDLYHVICLVR